VPETSNARPVVMVSSTVRDLPKHREHVRDACLRMGMYPAMMEHLPAVDADAIAASLAMVDEAEMYLGVFGHLYGYVPAENNPKQISITEMEYDRAIERGIPRLIFLMHDDHPIKAADVETGDGAEKLKAFKARLGTERVRDTFVSAEDLRGKIIHALSSYRTRDLTKFHYVSDIPEPPEPFIAHPYTLLQTHRLVGRQPELNLLTDWVAKPDSEVYKARILNVVAIGGMGKSALTWKWFNDIAPQEMAPLVGRMWWSFYESDATFENFVTRALAYVTRRPLSEVQQTPAPDRETQLLAALDREPFLLVLDGLERILIAYARMDAAHLSDDDYDRRTANYVANAYGLPASAAQSFTGEHRLRKTADPRAGSFLRKLSSVRASRILVSTRLYPADLQSKTDNPLPGCFAAFLPGLSDDYALDLWRAFGATGAHDLLLPLLQRADNHPLLIQALASEVARYRPAPGDFDAWRRAHPDFNPFGLPLVQVKSHVLACALHGLGDKGQQVLRTIAAFRMPARYDTLAALLIGEGKACADERELDGVLTELEDRGLVGWDKRANRYDLHPIVRGVVWGGLDEDTRGNVYGSLCEHFDALPIMGEDEVSSIEDLTPAIELFNTLIGLGRFKDAWEIFRARLDKHTHNRLSATRERIALLNMLFHDTRDYAPRLQSLLDHGWAIQSLAESHLNSGKPALCALLCLRLLGSIDKEAKGAYLRLYHAGLNDLSDSLCTLGRLREAEKAARLAVLASRKMGSAFWEAVSLGYLGRILSVRNEQREAENVLRLSFSMFAAQNRSRSQGVSDALLSDLFLWRKNLPVALRLANSAWEAAHIRRQERDFIRSSRLQGEALLGLGDFATADERLHHALARARGVDFVEEELPALVALAELRRRQGELGAARELLEDVWEAAERGPYPLVHADACCVLAEVERDEGNVEKAVEAAGKAYRLAWCDGPPFAYHWGLERARGLLRELGAGEPLMPAFDASRFEPMPEVEIDPADEFGAGSGGEG